MKYYILTAQTKPGTVGTIRGLTESFPHPEKIFKIAASVFLEGLLTETREAAQNNPGEVSAIESVNYVASLTPDDLVVLFFNFWECPDLGLGGK